MLPTSFVIMPGGCKFCRSMEKSVLIYNFTAPIGEKIDLVGLNHMDSRLAVLEKVSPGEMVKVPTTILDFTKPINRLGLTNDEVIMRLVLQSSTIPEYTTNLLRMLNGNNLNLY